MRTKKTDATAWHQFDHRKDMPFLNKKHSGFLLVVVLVLCARIPAGAAALKWYSSIEEASAEAQQRNRPMLVDFWADWCAACKVMEKEVYSKDDFAEASGQLLFVRIDYDKKQQIARKYRVTALPTIVFTDSYGAELFRYTGYISGQSLSDALRALPTDVTEFNRLNRILAQDKSNFKALEAMGQNLRAAGLFRASNDYYGQALRQRETKSDPSKLEAILDAMALNSLEVKDGKQAAERLEQCLKQFPNSGHKSTWTLHLGEAYAISDQKDRARRALETYLRDYSGQPDSAKAKDLLGSL